MIETILTITCPETGSAYSIDNEGTLFAHPIDKDGNILLKDVVFVEMDEINALDGKTVAAVKEVHHQLISCSKALGWYFKQ